MRDITRPALEAMGLERGLHQVALAALEVAGDHTKGTDAVDYMRRVLLTAERNHRLMATWQVRPVDVPVTLLRASNNAEGAPDLGWSEAMGRPIDVLSVPGDHQSMVRPRFVMASALWIEERLGPTAGAPPD